MSSQASPLRQSAFSSTTLTTWLAVAVIYAFLGFIYMPVNFYWSPDNGYKRIQADNIRLFDLTIQYRGNRLDPDYRFIPFSKIFYFEHNGEIRLSQTPIISLLAKPFIFLFGDRGEIIIPLLAGLVSIYLVGLLTEQLEFGPAWAGILLAGFATPLIIYSVLFWEHTLTIALTLGGISLALKTNRTAKHAALSGILIALTACIRKEMIFFAILFAIILIWQTFEVSSIQRRWFREMTWGIAFAVIYIGYELIIYIQTGNFVPPELSINTVPEYSAQSYLLVNGLLHTFSVFLFDHAYTSLSPIMLALISLYLIANVLRWQAVIQPIILMTLGSLIIYVMWKNWEGSQLYGIISVSPFLLLAFTHYKTNSAREVRPTRYLWFLTTGYFILAMLGRALFKRDQVPTTGPEWGLRYFLIVFVLGVPLAVRTMRTLSQTRKQSWSANTHYVVSLILVGMSILLQMLGVQTIRAANEAYQDRLSKTLALTDPIIVTDDQWLAPQLPKLFATKEVYKTDTLEDLRAWISRADADGVQQFTFISQSILGQEALAFIAPPKAYIQITQIIPLSNATLASPNEARVALLLKISRDAARPPYTLRLIADQIVFPTYLTYANDHSGRLFVTEKLGRIRLIQNGKLLPEPFLDISSLVSNDSRDRGLLSVAFPQDYLQSGLFWIYYSNLKGDAVVARYAVSADPNRANPASEQIILTMPHPNDIHYAGQLQFGIDGYLYISTGDNSTPEVSQRLDSLFGKLLRIDVRANTSPYRIPPDNPFVNRSEARPEIWAYGLRNPWRFSFDRATDDLFIADVGETQYEEINLQLAPSGGGINYGWNQMEGFHVLNPFSKTFTLPIVEMGHKEYGMCAAVGGYLYRGQAIPDLQGTYLFGDFCSGQLWTLRRSGGEKWQIQKIETAPPLIGLSSFGEDEQGEIYLVDILVGAVYQLQLNK